jgi:hypothetical protein
VKNFGGCILQELMSGEHIAQGEKNKKNCKKEKYIAF